MHSEQDDVETLVQQQQQQQQQQQTEDVKSPEQQPEEGFARQPAKIRINDDDDDAGQALQQEVQASTEQKILQPVRQLRSLDFARGLTKRQAEEKKTATPEEAENLRRRAAIKEMFLHAWKGYKQHAWGTSFPLFWS
jgi:hypothetical protein